MLDQIKQEREHERWRAIHDLERDEAEYRAGVIAAAAISSFGAKKSNDEAYGPYDFFADPRKRAVDAASAAGDAISDASEEMSTEQTVERLTRGFGNYVPDNLRDYAGLT